MSKDPTFVRETSQEFVSSLESRVGRPHPHLPRSTHTFVFPTSLTLPYRVRRYVVSVNLHVRHLLLRSNSTGSRTHVEPLS